MHEFFFGIIGMHLKIYFVPTGNVLRSIIIIFSKILNRLLRFR